MFFIINKDKIISYLVAFSTVIVLLVISATSIQKPETAAVSSSEAITKHNIICGE